MQRPVMNPNFVDEPAAAETRTAGPSRWVRAARLLVRLGRIFVTDLLRYRRDGLRVDVGSPLSRFVRGLMYRLMFVPIVLAIIVTALVATATHPRPTPAVADPTSAGIYYDPVELLSLDNTRLEGWLVPVIDAHRVLIEGDDLLLRRYPAIVLAHDFAASRQQLLPLIAPLHEAGYVVLAVNLRGHGPGAPSVGATFGLNESQDVRAAVEMLRRRNFVDADAIGLVGVGTGATACLLAAQQDPRLRIMVLDHPVRQFDDILAHQIGPRQAWLAWLRPMCQWTFEIAYKVNANDVNLNRFGSLMSVSKVLLFDDLTESASLARPAHQRETVDFLKRYLTPRGGTAVLPPRDPLQAGAIGRLSMEDDTGIKVSEWPRQERASDIFGRRDLRQE